MQSTVRLSDDDVKRLGEAIRDGYLFTAPWTTPDTRVMYADSCFRQGRVLIIVSPVQGRAGYRNVVVDTFPVQPSLSQAKGLEVAMRQYGDVYQLAAPEDTRVSWRVEVTDGDLMLLVPRVLAIFDMLPTVDAAGR